MARAVLFGPRVQLSKIAFISILATTGRAFADDALPPPVAAPQAIDQGRVEMSADNPSGHFSVGRFLVEMVASAAIGGLAAYFTYTSMCDGGDCIGPALLAMTADIAITPLAVWGVGSAMGGDGSLKMAYYGGILPFAASSGVSAQDAGVALGVSIAMMPIVSALFYELQSHVRSVPHAIHVAATPVVSHGSVAGATLALSAAF